MSTVKEACEAWGKEHNITVTESQFIKELQEENEKLRNVLRRIDTWAKAYPLKVFPKPDLKKAHEVLKAAGMTLDAISADNMRHVLDQIKEMVSEVLKEE